MRTHHAFQSVEFDIVVQDKSEGDLLFDQLQNRLDNSWNEIGERLEKLSAKNKWIFIDRLELSLGNVNRGDIFQKLERALITAIESRIHLKQIVPKTQPTQGVLVRNTPQKLMEVFLYFLKVGRFEWDAPISNILELEDYLLKEIASGEVQNIWEEILRTEISLYRFIHQFSVPVKIQLLISVLRREEQIFMPYDDIVPSDQLRAMLSQELSISKWISLFKEVAKYNNKISLDEMYKRIISICNSHSGRSLPVVFDDIVNPEQKIIQDRSLHLSISNQNDTVQEESLFVDGAGVILMHPFLQTFFDHLGLLKDNRFENYEDHAKAVYLLFYVITGRKEAKEFELVFSKFLLNYHVESPLLPLDKFPEEWNIQCQKMLEAVIRNWAALKNTSIEGLRSTFFERQGKITKVESGYKLQIEKKGVDVLLEYLPWSVSVVSLPWLPDPIFVEWV